MELEDIIFSGDSAGGHLAVSVAMLAILRGFRKPDAILCHYPVFCIDLNRFVPSVMLSVDEELLSSAFMDFCFTVFTRNGGIGVNNPLLSPLYAPNALYNLLPMIKLMPAEVDPLRD